MFEKLRFIWRIVRMPSGYVVLTVPRTWREIKLLGD